MGAVYFVCLLCIDFVVDMLTLSFELGIYGGVITAVFFCMLSEGILCHNTVVCLCLGLYVLQDSNTYELSCPVAQLVESPCRLQCAWVRFESNQEFVTG